MNVKNILRQNRRKQTDKKLFDVYILKNNLIIRDTKYNALYYHSPNNYVQITDSEVKNNFYELAIRLNYSPFSTKRAADTFCAYVILHSELADK